MRERLNGWWLAGRRSIRIRLLLTGGIAAAGPALLMLLLTLGLERRMNTRLDGVLLRQPARAIAVPYQFFG